MMPLFFWEESSSRCSGIFFGQFVESYWFCFYHSWDSLWNFQATALLLHHLWYLFIHFHAYNQKSDIENTGGNGFYVDVGVSCYFYNISDFFFFFLKSEFSRHFLLFRISVLQSLQFQISPVYLQFHHASIFCSFSEQDECAYYCCKVMGNACLWWSFESLLQLVDLTISSHAFSHWNFSCINHFIILYKQIASL